MNITIWICVIGWAIGLPAVSGLVGHWFRDDEGDLIQIAFPLLVLSAMWPILIWVVVLSWPFRLTRRPTHHNEVNK